MWKCEIIGVGYVLSQCLHACPCFLLLVDDFDLRSVCVDRSLLFIIAVLHVACDHFCAFVFMRLAAFARWLLLFLFDVVLFLHDSFLLRLSSMLAKGTCSFLGVCVHVFVVQHGIGRHLCKNTGELSAEMGF